MLLGTCLLRYEYLNSGWGLVQRYLFVSREPLIKIIHKIIRGQENNWSTEGTAATW